MNSLQAALFAALFFALYILAAFVWPSIRTYRSTGVNPLVLGRTDSAHDYIGRCFKALLACVPVIVGLVYFPHVYAYLLPASFLETSGIRYTGVALCLVSLLWTVLAQAQMGRSWRIGIDTVNKTALVWHGVFGVSRNPVFLGMIVTLTGFFLLLPNAVSLVVLACGWLLIQIQIRLEEEALAHSHGAAYAEYKARVRRLL